MSNHPATKLSCSEVDLWLQHLKLSQYAHLFRQSGLSELNECKKLTILNLKQMGISLPGHVSRMTKAIAKLSNDDVRLGLKGAGASMSRRMSKSSEHIRNLADENLDYVYFELSEVIDMSHFSRSESNPDLRRSPIPFSSTLSRTPPVPPPPYARNRPSTDYFDTLEALKSYINEKQANTWQVYDVLEPEDKPMFQLPAGGEMDSHSEEMTALDPLTQQPLTFVHSKTEVFPVPIPRVLCSKHSAPNPTPYKPRTRQKSLNEHKYAFIDESQIEEFVLPLMQQHLKKPKPSTSHYDQLDAVSLEPTIMPETCAISPTPELDSLPISIETMVALGLKTNQGDPNHLVTPIPTPRRSPSSPSLPAIETSPKLPSRLHSHSVHSAQISNYVSPPKHSFSGAKSSSNKLPTPLYNSRSPDPTPTYPSPLSPLEKVPNPIYVPSSDIQRLYSMYTPMRPASPTTVPYLESRDQAMPLEVVSGSSSEDELEVEDELMTLSPAKVTLTSLPVLNQMPTDYKRSHSLVGLSKQYSSPKLSQKFVSSGRLLPQREPEITAVSTLEGWLYKQGGLRANKGWKKRWVIFDGYELKYFKSETAKECQGRIPLGTMKEIQTGLETHEAVQNGDVSIRVLGRQTRFILVTLSRSFYFHVATERDFKRWVNTLQTAITKYKPNAEAIPEGGTMNEPDKTGILLKQGHNLSKDWKPRFCALKDSRLAYYYSEGEFKVGNPINTINMRLASVRPRPGPDGQPRFEIVIVGGRNYMFECSELSELQEWIDALMHSVLQALTLFDQDKGTDYSSQDILSTLYTNPGNQECADCLAANPSWVSLNLCVLVCIECSGVHRALGAHISKMRSVDLDKTVWTPVLIELLICLGNDEVNKIYLDRYHGQKMFSDEQNDIRKNFITAKYKEKAWMKRETRGSVAETFSEDDQTELNQSLCETALNGTLLDTLHLLLQGADPTYSEPVPRIAGQPASTPLQLTKAADKYLHHELLSQWRVQEYRNSFTNTLERSHLSEYMHKYSPATTKGPGRPQLRPTWQKRFFVLRKEGLSILKSERDLDPEGEILASEILLVQETKDLPEPQDGKFPHVFELISSKPAIYAFSTPTRQDMERWVCKLKNILNPDGFQLHGFDRWGYLKIRTNQTSPWKQRFCYLKSRVLVTLSLDKAEPEKIYLQSCLSIQPPIDPALGQARELSMCFQIIMQEKTYSIHTSSYHEAKLWYQVLKRTQVFGVPMEEQQCTSSGVPLLMHKCIEFIEGGRMEEDGLYRLSGRNKLIDDLILQFDQDCKALVINPEVFSVHDVAGVLKRFLRALPEPLLTKELYPEFVSSVAITQHDDLMYAIQGLIMKMPREYKNTLLRLCEHLKQVAELEAVNRMGVHNLATVFGPNIRGASASGILDEKDLMHVMEKEAKLMEYLIQHYEWLFDVKNDKDQKKKMEEAIEKMRYAHELTKRNTLSRVESNDFLITIFIEDKHGETITMKANIQTTARKVFNHCVCKKSIAVDTLALYEILGKNESERVVHPEEQILKVVSSWSNRNNYLCIKINSVVRRICDFNASRTDRVSLYMKGKNRWKKHLFWVNGEWLFSQKEGKAIFAREGPQTTKLDFVLFIGLLQSDISRNSPTKWGFWLQRAYDDDTHRYLCADTEQEMYRFIACFLHAKYPNGLNSLTYTPACDSTAAGNLSTRSLSPAVNTTNSNFFTQSTRFGQSSGCV